MLIGHDEGCNQRNSNYRKLYFKMTISSTNKWHFRKNWDWKFLIKRDLRDGTTKWHKSTKKDK